MPQYYDIPGVGLVEFPDGTPRDVAYQHFNVPTPEPDASSTTSAVGAFGRGAVRGLAPAAAGLAAAAPGAEAGMALGGALTFGNPIGAGIGGLIGGAITGLPAAFGAGYVQDQAFQAAPGVASALGQSPEQRAADEQYHPYAAMLGEAAPNLAAFRPSRLPFLNTARAATPEAAAAIRSARVNMGINAGVSGAQEAGMEYSQTGEVDPYAVALQAGVGALGSKETFIGRRLSGTAAILPKGVRDAADRYMGREPISEDAPTNLLWPSYDKRETWAGPSEKPLALPSPETAGRYDYNYRRNQLTEDEQRNAGMGRWGTEDQRPFSDYAFEQSPEGTQGNLFGFPDAQRESDLLAPKVEGRPTDAAPERDPAQLDMFEERPTSMVRTGFSAPDIAARIVPEGSKPDAFSNKVSTRLASLLYDGRGMEANAFLEGERQALETAAVTPATIERRSAILENAQREMDAYSQQMMQGYADEGMNAARPGVTVDTDPGAIIRQRIAEQQQQQAAEMQARQAQEAEQQQMTVGEIREQTLRDILEHGNPKNLVPEFMKFLTSGKGQWGEVGLRDNERAMLDQAREIRRKREDVKRAVAEQQKQIEAKQQKDAAGEQRRIAMEQRFQNEKSQREAERALSRTEATREQVPVTPEPEPQPTLADLMERAKPAEVKSGTVLDRVEGSTLAVKAQEPAKSETVGEKIKKKVAAKREARKPLPKEETPTQAMKPEPQPKAKPKVEEPANDPVVEKIKDQIYDLRTNDDKAGLLRLAKRLRDNDMISEGDHASIKEMAKDRDMGADDIGPDLELSVELHARDKAKNAAPDEVTYDSVLKEADSYLAADGESGLLKPTEYQRLSQWAENETFTPQELKQKLDDAVNQRREKLVSEASGTKTEGRTPRTPGVRQPSFGKGEAQFSVRTSRRQFLKGLAATAASAAVNKPALARTPIKSASDLHAALKSGSLKEALGYVAKNGSTPILRKVAAIINRNGIDGLRVTVLNGDDVAGMSAKLRAVGVSEENIADVVDGSVLGLVSANAGDSQLFIIERTGQGNGLTEETFMHELIHAYVKSRWYRLGIFGDKDQGALLKEAGIVTGDVPKTLTDFHDLARAVGDEIIKQFKASNGEFFSTQIEAAQRSDEMLSYVMESPEVQGLLKRMYRDGNKWVIEQKPRPVTEADTSVWGRIVQFFRDLFGISANERSAFDELLDAGYSVLEEGANWKSDFKVGKQIEEFNAKAEAASPRLVPSRVTVEKTIEKMPEPLRDPAYRIWDTIHNAAAKGKAAVMFTEDLIAGADKLLPSGKDYVRTMVDKVTTQRKLENSVNTLGEDHMRLSDKERGLGKGTVNGAIQYMREEAAWGFKPDWLDADVTVDPEAERMFNALSKSGQEVVKGVFRESHKLLQEQRAVTTDNINTTYDRMIAEARAAGDEDRAVDLDDERKLELQQFKALLNMDETIPYASTRRYGNYLVVGKSPEMVEAIKAGDTKEINRLKTDEKHYFVNMYETMWEAKAEARKLADQGAFPAEHVEAYEKDRARDELVGGKEMMMAFQRLRDYIANSTDGVDVDPRVKNSLERLATDLYIRSLHSTSSRKSELRRQGVSGGNMDMMRNFITQSRATAHLIGALKHNEQVLDTITKMRNEAGNASGKNKEQAMRVYNEVMLRHLAGMQYRPNTFTDNLKSGTSMYFLVTSPSYYLQNLTQFAALSAPTIAGKHGYAGVFDQAFKSYREIAAIRGKGVSGALDVDRIGDPGVRRAIQEIADRGGIDIGIDSEMGRFHSMSKGVVSANMAKADAFLRNLTRKAESVNRVVTVATAYNLEKRALTKRGGLTPEQVHQQAVEYAYNVNRTTNGSYDGFNAPRFMRTPVGSVVTQFKKFQLMQLTLLGKMATEALRGATPVERAIARRSLAYTMGHTAILAGAMGLPGAAAAQWFLDTFVMGDEDEPGDIERQMRDAIGDDTMADLILKGAPTLSGVDISSRVGMGQALSLLPFTDIKPSQQGYEAVATAMLGPALGGVGPRFADGTAKMLQGNYWKGLERFLPKGLSDASAAIRERSQGVTKNNNDMLLDPDDITFADTFARVMGVQTSKVATRYRLSNEQYATKEFYDRRAQEVNNQFANAWKQGDAAGMAEARAEFRDLQTARVKNGLSRQPFSVLLRYARQQQRRERATVGGVQYQPKSPALRRALAEADDE